MKNINKKALSLVLVGIGRVAQKHAKAVKHLKGLYNIVALVDKKTENKENLNEKFKLNLQSDFLLDDLNEVYQKGLNPDVVAISTPSGTHYALAKLALENNSNVLIEKPLTLNLKEAHELVNLAKEKNLKIAVGHIYRFFPLVKILQEEIKAGKWGKVLSANILVHWGHDQAYYDQAAWRGSWAQDGGVLMNQTVHALDLMTWLLSSNVSKVQGNIKQLYHEMEAEDYGTAILTMDKGYICRVEGTTNTPEKNPSASFYISTEKAEIKAGIEKKKPYVSIVTRDGKKLGAKYIRSFIGDMLKNGFIRSLNEFSNPHTGIYKDLAVAIVEDREPRANGLDGLLSVECILAIYQSALEGGAVIDLPLNTDFTLEKMKGFFDN